MNRPGPTHSAGGGARNYVGLGIVETVVAADALRAATKSLDLRFVRIVGTGPRETAHARYRVEVPMPTEVDAQYAIKAWEAIKDMLRESFPAGGSGAQAMEIIDT